MGGSIIFGSNFLKNLDNNWLRIYLFTEYFYGLYFLDLLLRPSLPNTRARVRTPFRGFLRLRNVYGECFTADRSVRLWCGGINQPNGLENLFSLLNGEWTGVADLRGGPVLVRRRALKQPSHAAYCARGLSLSKFPFDKK